MRDAPLKTLTTFWSDPARRTVLLLAIAQASFMSVQSAGIATTPLAGHMLLTLDKQWATLPVFLTHLGIMATTVPASFLMKRIGRRGGFSIGAMIGIASGLVSTLAIYQQSFSLLCVGAFAQGMAAAFAWYFRFAAAEVADEAFKPKAISLVMAGGLVAGLLGPQVAKDALNWLAPVTFAGIYVMIALFSAAVLVIVQGLKIPQPSAEEREGKGRPLSVIIREPRFITALTSSMFGYAVMTLIMASSPLAMLACGFGFADSASVIQVHVVAMFAPAFFTGHLITRFGVLPVIATGALLQALCAVVHLAGIAFENFFAGLALLGLGWSFTFIGGTTLLTSVYSPQEKAKVQAAHDFAVYGATAAAAAAAGFMSHQAGWAAINIAALPLMALVIGATLWLGYRQSRRAPA
ncbi:MAG: MFS transporter [Pseudomonadota bacterium]